MAMAIICPGPLARYRASILWGYPKMDIPGGCPFQMETHPHGYGEGHWGISPMLSRLDSSPHGYGEGSSGHNVLLTQELSPTDTGRRYAHFKQPPTVYRLLSAF